MSGYYSRPITPPLARPVFSLPFGMTLVFLLTFVKLEQMCLFLLCPVLPPDVFIHYLAVNSNYFSVTAVFSYCQYTKKLCVIIFIHVFYYIFWLNSIIYC